MSASIAQVQRVLDQVIRAVEFLFGFTLAAGLVVLFAAVTATREARAREFAVMRALGASGQLLARRCSAPSCSASARWPALLASVAAMAVGWALARYVFEFSWNPSPLGAAGRRRWPARCSRSPPAGGACARCCAGRWSQTLRQAADV